MAKNNPVAVKNAEIKQVSVTINVMSVNNKQMTLSVFRQLPVADFISEDGYLDEDFSYWGIVRYCFDNCGVWAVAEYNGELYRSKILYEEKKKSLCKSTENRNLLFNRINEFDDWLS